MLKILAILTLVAMAVPVAAGGQDDPRLDDLFARLQATEDAAKAGGLAASIWDIWTTAEDQEAQALMDRGEGLIATGQAEAAIEVYDELVEMRPDWAEAWNKRATAHYMAGNYAASVADIQETVEREPRHFGAWSGLGLIYMRRGQHELALRAFEKALEHNPHAGGARANAEAMRERLEDERI